MPDLDTISPESPFHKWKWTLSEQENDINLEEKDKKSKKDEECEDI